MKSRNQQSMQGARLTSPPVHRISAVQITVLLAVCLASYFGSPLIAQSLFWGGMIAVIPQVYFASRLFRFSGAKAATQVARAGFAGEIGKFILAVAGFGLVFALVRPIEGWAVFAGFGGMVVIQTIGAWLLLR